MIVIDPARAYSTNVRWCLDIDGERYVERTPFGASDEIRLLDKEIQ